MKPALIKAFGACKFPAQCTCVIKEPFESISEPIFYVYDEGTADSPVKIVAKGERYQLTVRNPLQKEICLVKMDKCLIPKDDSKCECLLFDDRKFVLIEIKTSGAGGRGARRRKAAEQLESTIHLLQNNGIDLSGYEVIAQICFRSIEPRIPQASKNSAQANFQAQYRVSLMEGNVIEF